MGALYALLVGIDAYPAPVPPLSGCVNDVLAVQEALTARVGGDVLRLRTLLDAEATRDAFTAAVTGHLGQAGPDDVALLYYSGHGSQQDTPEELWSVEPDHQNETVVLVDSREPGRWDLADKELAALVGEVAATGCHLLVVLDCCHSGDGTRDLDEVVRLAPGDTRPRPADSFLPGAATVATRSLDGETQRWTTASAGHVLLAACRSDEKAREITVQGRRRGALSAALEATLREAEGRPTYREVLRIVTSGVQRRVEGQHPQLEAFDPKELDRPFLGGAIPAAPRQLTLSHLPDGWSIDSGAVHGVPEPIGEDSTELAVYPLTAETTGRPLATATVTKVLPGRSLVSVSAELDPGFVYRAVITSIPLRPLAVAVRGPEQERAALRAAASEADATLIDLVDDVAGAELVVEAGPDGFVVTRPGVTRPLVPVLAGERREERTIGALEHVARWLRLAALRNPATRLPEKALRLTVTTEAGGLTDDGSVRLAYRGETPPEFTVTLENRTDQPLWGALLDLTETYGIYTDAFPAGSVSLGPGESTSVTLSGQVPDALWRAGTVAVTDRLKVVTSTLEFDPRSLEQDDLDVQAVGGGAASVVRGGLDTLDGPRSTLDRLLTSVTTRRLGPRRETDKAADWRTDELDITTTRPRD